MATLECARVLNPQLTPAEMELAASARRCLVAALDHSRAASITIEGDNGEPPSVQLPPQTLRVIASVLGLMAEGRPVVLMPARQELSTVEAAHVLNVSRPFVIKEIEAGRLKCRLVGTHRRILYDDLQQYRAEMQKKQQAALQSLADDSNEQGLDY